MIAWPSFGGTKLPLSQPARQQLSRIYSDLRNNLAVAQRKAGLLRWIQSSAFVPGLDKSKKPMNSFFCLQFQT
jgi:hypothetical protein